MKKILRLNEQFNPKHYDLHIKTDLISKKFNGFVEIIGDTFNNQSSILLHSKKLNITSAKIDGVEAVVGAETDHNEIALSTDEPIEAGEHTISIEYDGEISPSMLGIYLSSYNEGAEEKKIVATQFESNHAREALPCIDEPSAKATFKLDLTHPKDLTAFSNMPILSQSTKDDMTTTRFEVTPIMSTYLLAFVIGELHYIEKTTTSGVQLRCVANTATDKRKLQFSLDEAVKILEFFEEYFDTSYPLSKCDLIALPDFDAGAMENWGIITFREIALLTDPDNRSVSSEQYVSMVVAHELAHMWFGNLVTMKWWDDLWLNESFASLMEHIALDNIHPEWHQWEHYAAMDILSATSRDINQNIQPISIELDDPEMIETMFDPGIVYTKGGRLLKALIEFIGEETFRKGLKKYFDSNKFSNATRDDLWAALESVSNKDIKSLMDPWLNQPGMPVVTIDQSLNSVKLSQKRFILGDSSSNNDTWPIPTLASNKSIPLVVSSKTESFKISDPEYVVLNERASSHFISKYLNPEHKVFIDDKIVKKQLSSEFRISYINDQILLSKNNEINYTELLDLVSRMKLENRFSVWSQIARAISYSYQLTEGDENSKQLIHKLRISLVKDMYGELGVHDKPNDSSNTIQIRSLVYSIMLGSESEDAIADADRLLREAKNPENLPSESRSSTLSALIMNGDDELARSLSKSYIDASSEMQLDIVSSIASTKNPSLISEILDEAIGANGYVRPQDTLRWIAICLRNHYIRDDVWRFLEDNWDHLEAQLTQSKSFDFLPTYCASVCSTSEQLDTYKNFFDPLQNNKFLKRNIEIGIKEIEARIKWRRHNQPLVEEWLKERF